MSVSTFNHDWYKCGNICGNIIQSAEFPKLNFLIKKRLILTKCKYMTVDCARMRKTLFLINYQHDKSKSTPSPTTRTPANFNQFVFPCGVWVSRVLLYYLPLCRFSYETSLWGTISDNTLDHLHSCFSLIWLNRKCSKSDLDFPNYNLSLLRYKWLQDVCACAC